MIQNYIDTHAHIFSLEFHDDFDAVIARAHDAGVYRMMIVTTDEEEALQAIEFVKKDPVHYQVAYGIHPEYVKDATSEKLRKLEEIISKKEITAVGEIGMDLYYESDTREAQKELFIYQIELAKKYNKPILVHSRDAMQDTYDIMKEHHVRGLLHCFSGSAEMAVEFTKLGYYIALGGAATFKNARHALEVCKAIDMKYLLSETDCPYMAPVPVRGTRNEPCNIPYIVDVLAKTRDISVEEMANTIDENYKRFLKEINESN